MLDILATTSYVRIMQDKKYEDRRHLGRYGLRIYSQNGEDGIISRLIDILEVSNKTFLEIGSGDGTENNTRALLSQGWIGTWIEGSKKNIRRTRHVFHDEINDGRLKVVEAIATPSIIDRLIATSAHSNPSILSIDVDMDTHHLWRAINSIEPDIVVVEYNAYWRPPIEWESPYIEGQFWDGRTLEFGASLKTLEIIGNDKGYRLVGCDLCGVNAFFVKEELATHDNFIMPFDSQTHYEPPRYWLLPPGKPRWS